MAEEEEEKWEQRDTPSVHRDPPKSKAGPNCSHGESEVSVPYLLLQTQHRQGYVRVISQSALWEHHGSQDTHSYQGLTIRTVIETTWTTICGIWNHLLVKRPLVGQNLVDHVRDETVRHESLETKGYRSPSRRMRTGGV